MSIPRAYEVFVQSETITRLAFLLAVYSIYTVACIVYRLYFSPIAKFPGPKLAAATYLYEIYYDVLLGGQYTTKIKELHQQYGPILRISPEEIHINDTSFLGPLYTPAPVTAGKPPKRYKWGRQVNTTGFPEAALVSTTDHDLHRHRRKPLAPFFTVAQVRKTQAHIYTKAETLCTRLREEAASGAPVRIKLAYSCYTGDVISEYLLGTCFDYLAHPGFNPDWSNTVTELAKGGHLLRPLPWLAAATDYIPRAVHRFLGPGMQAILSARGDTKRHLAVVKARVAARRGSSIPKAGASKEEGGHGPTVMEALLESPLPAAEKTDFRMQMEIETIMAAGTETTATVLGVLTVYVLDTPGVLEALRRELETAIPDPAELPGLQVLERLPYLTGVVREGMRLGYGIYTRGTRLAEEPLVYGEWVIPPMTPVSMTNGFTHVNPAVWGEEAARFMPERWADPEESARLYRYLTSFSKGSRMCLGINMAYAEIYVATAAIFRRFDWIELCNYSREDVEEVVADWNMPRFRKAINELSVFMK